MSETLTIDADITDRSSLGIARAIGRLVTSGELAVGQQLPTVRATARELGVSPTTVSDAWRILRSHGVIATDGRRGTYVRRSRDAVAPGRHWQVPVLPGTFAVDLSTGTPDNALLPPLEPALSSLRVDASVGSYLDDPVVPELAAALTERWPFEPEALTVVDGAQDALDRLVTCVVSLGDRVLINEPAFPPLLDMLELAGAEIIGLPMDEQGIAPDALEEALQSSPAALFLQPRAHNPTGVTMTAKRATELAKVLRKHDTLIVEDDHSGDVSGAPLNSLGAHLPARVVHIRSYSKSHGPDLRLAAIGGAYATVDAITRRRRMGPGWSPLLLQHLLLQMLTDNQTQARVDEAAAVYHARREAFVAALANHGVQVRGSAGINLWIPVADEQIALVSLAAVGIGAAPGSPFIVSESTQDHIRISIGAIDEGIESLAEHIARAALTEPGARP